MTSTLPPLVQAFSGAIGSATANSLTYPLDLVTTRLQLQSQPKGKPPRKSGGIAEGVTTLQKIFRKSGLTALYDGILTDTGATLLSNFFYFYFYSFLRTNFIARLQVYSKKKTGKTRPVKLSIFQELILGFISGVASRAVSSPLNIITLRLQTERSHQQDEDDDTDAKDSGSSGVSDVVKHIYEEEGLAGFWRGFKTATLLSLNPSITLAFFQLFRHVLLLSQRRSPNAALPNPSPIEAFVGAAVSNSIAVTLLYPLILAKTRLQARRSLPTITELPSSYEKEPPSTPKKLPSSDSLSSVLLDAYTGRLPSGIPRYREAGIKGLYQALQMQVFKGFFSQGVTFLVKGRIEQAVVNTYLRRHGLT